MTGSLDTGLKEDLYLAMVVGSVLGAIRYCPPRQYSYLCVALRACLRYYVFLIPYSAET